MASKFLLGCVVALAGAAAFAQEPPPPAEGAQPPPAQLLTPAQLDTLVAPVALYPDNLLAQILAASTYPLEVVEANQWLQQNQNKKWSVKKQVDEARKQNWDPSVQALVAFPDVLTRLNQDVRWTTDLGDAFLAQQADVMAAVQRMRAKAEADGKLRSTPQETVTTQNQDGQSAIVIEPANPQVVYVPVYNPEYIWGPPLWGVYPPLFYPGIGIGIGFTFGPGIYIDSFFGGCCGWGEFGWGWGLGWFGSPGILVNNYFLHRYGFRELHGGEFRGTEAWAHNPEHRLGVPYPNRALNERFHAGSAMRGAARAPSTPRAAPSQRFGTQGFERQNPGGNHSVFGGIRSGGETRIQSDHGFSSMRGGFGGGVGGGGFRGGGAPRGGGGRGRR